MARGHHPEHLRGISCRRGFGAAADTTSALLALTRAIAGSMDPDMIHLRPMVEDAAVPMGRKVVCMR
jgi:hypothetical protein